MVASYDKKRGNSSKQIIINLYRLKKYFFDMKKLYPSVQNDEVASLSLALNQMFDAFHNRDYLKLKNLLLSVRGLIYIMSDTYPDAAYYLLPALHLNVKTEELVNRFYM